MELKGKFTFVQKKLGIHVQFFFITCNFHKHFEDPSCVCVCVCTYPKRNVHTHAPRNMSEQPMCPSWEVHWVWAVPTSRVPAVLTSYKKGLQRAHHQASRMLSLKARRLKRLASQCHLDTIWNSTAQTAGRIFCQCKYAWSTIQQWLGGLTKVVLFQNMGVWDGEWELDGKKAK